MSAQSIGNKSVYVVAGTGTRGIKQVNVTGTTGAGVFKTWQQVTAAQYAQGPTGQFETIQRTNPGAVLSQSIKTVCIPSFVDPNAGGGGGYTASAVHFDGSTTVNTPSLTVADSFNGTISFWFNDDSDWTAFATNDIIGVLAGFNFGCGMLFSPGSTPGNFGGYWGDVTGGVTSQDGNVNQAPAQSYTSGAWHHLLFSWNTNFAANSRKFVAYLDDQLMTYTGTQQGPAYATNYDGSGDSTPSDHTFFVGGGAADIGALTTGDFADLFFDAVHTVAANDGTISAVNRRKFISAALKPVSLGGDGSLPFGSQPTIFCTGDASTFANNAGTGGGFTITGALTNASTHP